MKQISKAAVLGVLLGNLALADISYTGLFAHDDQMFSVGFSLTAPTNIVLQTWSFGGGTDAAGHLIPAGGFAPVVSLFDSSGNLLAFDDGGTAPGGGCGPRSLDPVTGFCLDAFIHGAYPAGSYTAVLTEWDSTPNGPTLADGFLEQGNGDFTGGPFFLNAGSGYQRTGDWELDVPGVDPPTPAPEPVSAIPLALVLCVVVRRKICKVILLVLPIVAGAPADIATITLRKVTLRSTIRGLIFIAEIPAPGSAASPMVPVIPGLSCTAFFAPPRA